ncbi:unnamed protein product, partial [Polarella glacialis]
SDGSACFGSDAEGGDDQPPDDIFGEAGDINGELEEDGSGSDGERQDLKACGVNLARGDSPSSERDSGEESNDEQAQGVLMLAGRSVICSEDSALVQATKLSRFRAAPASSRQQTCGECLTRKVPKGTDTCSSCKKELKQLKQSLRRPLAS